MTFPESQLPFLAPNTICPDPSDTDLYIPYFNRLYEDIALVVNQKDWRFFTIAVGTTPTPIPNIGTTGAYIICVSGTMDGMPAVTYSLIKTNSTVVGIASQIQVQPGTNFNDITTWNGVNLFITPNATTTNFEISHNAAAGTVGNFNIKFIGTQ